ncbi:MAG: response regulator transcription factor [Burkholderiaceae bacterium]
MNRVINVLLVDDHALMREGMRMMLSREPDVRVVGEAEEGGEGVRLALQLRPDVVVMDLSMPGMNGAKATERLRELSPEVAVIALTRHVDQGYLQHAMRAGARGYVIKKAAAEELLTAIRRVADGETYVDPGLASRMVGRIMSSTPFERDSGSRPLSPREEQVLRLIALGHSNAEIAAELGISVKTVEYQRARGMEKLGIRSRVQIVQHALREGWLDDA